MGVSLEMAVVPADLLARWQNEPALLQLVEAFWGRSDGPYRITETLDAAATDEVLAELDSPVRAQFAHHLTLLATAARANPNLPHAHVRFEKSVPRVCSLPVAAGEQSQPPATRLEIAGVFGAPPIAGTRTRSARLCRCDDHHVASVSHLLATWSDDDLIALHASRPQQPPPLPRTGHAFVYRPLGSAWPDAWPDHWQESMHDDLTGLRRCLAEAVRSGAALVVGST